MADDARRLFDEEWPVRFNNAKGSPVSPITAS